MERSFTRKIPKHKVVHSFSPKHKPVEYVVPCEKILLETEDALGGQVKDESVPIERLDWSKVNGATGPIFINGAEPEDTLIVNIEEIRVAEKAS
jgi:amidase